MPRPITTNELFELTGKTHKTIKGRLSNLAPTGTNPGRGGGDTYNSADALTLIYNGDRPEASTATLTEARTRESLAKALGAEIDNETKLKTRIPIEIVNDANDAFFGLLKAKIMGSKMSDADKRELIDEMREIPTKLKW
jgi:hypothetical protein